MYTFNFNSKAQYLQQKREWHDAFIAQVTLIRALKNDIKAAQRVYQSVWPVFQAIKVAHADLTALLVERARSRAESYKQMIIRNPDAVSFHDGLVA